MGTMVVILGMHRSGTSFLAKALHQVGMYLGAGLMDGPSVDNLEGHSESWEAVRINDRILALSGGSWDRAPATLCGDDEAALGIKAFLHRLSAQPIAGWKDPRTTLTFPLWKLHLADYHIVACLRHPLNVARSLQTREGFSLEFGLSLWTDYNSRLLQLAEAETRPVHWFDFDESPDNLQRTVASICHRLGLRVDASFHQVFNPYLRHQEHPDDILNPCIRALFDRLKERASQEPLSHLSVQPVAHADQRQHQHDCLARVQQRQNEVLQRLHASHRQTEQAVAGVQVALRDSGAQNQANAALVSRVSTLENELRQLRNRLEEAVGATVDLQTEFDKVRSRLGTLERWRLRRFWSFIATPWRQLKNRKSALHLEANADCSRAAS